MDMVISGLTKSFGGEKVLAGFSAVFEDGKKYCVTGRSGSGKTTLLNILLGLLPADAGTVSGNDAPIACVFQEDRLLMGQTAETNITAVVRKKLSSDEITADLASVGIVGEDLKKPLSQFSGGMLRRVAIVRAMIADRAVLLLDEPFKGLDGELKKRVMDYVIKRSSGKLLIFTTHELSEAKYLGAKIVKLTD